MDTPVTLEIPEETNINSARVNEGGDDIVHFDSDHDASYDEDSDDVSRRRNCSFFSLYVAQTLGVLTTAGRLRVTKSFTTAGQQCTKSGKYHTIDNRTCTI